MTALTGKDIVCIGIAKGLNINLAEEFGDGLSGYGEPLAGIGGNYADSFAAIADQFEPGTWFNTYSSYSTYIIMYYKDPTTTTDPGTSD